MAETVGTPSQPPGRSGPGRGRKQAAKPAQGITVERIHTTPGVHPYDEVVWEHRDVVMTNWRDGTVNFEQRGVEFPEFWSVNATNIVTSKYFRGAVGSPARESSLRQLIDRVVGVYHATGVEQGYFASDADAEIFAHELTWMLLHQVFSFNSPVWFNVGTASPQQVSACIVRDSLVSTPAGLIPIGELVERDAVGTKLFDAHGLTSIVATKANGVREVVRLSTKSGHRLDLTPDHVVWKSTGSGSGQWVAAGTLQPGDALEWHRTHSFGDVPIEISQVAEATLAGWLQSDGFVGQYASGTNRSLTIEAMTVTAAELDWVRKSARQLMVRACGAQAAPRGVAALANTPYELRAAPSEEPPGHRKPREPSIAGPSSALDTVFPGVHRHERSVVTQDPNLDCRRTRLYGAELAPFVERWGLRTRGVHMEVPAQLFTAPLPVVACYLRSLFQAEGYVSRRESSTLVGMDMISEQLIRGVQSLLGRFGIFARVGKKVDKRDDRHDLWGIRIQNAGDRRIFADEIGFIDPVKTDKLEASFDQPGRGAHPVKRLEIAAVEELGAQEVFDIQTESGEFLVDGLRVHNCFILAVDDTMESILNWYREEGLIFKGGSGAGLNLSRIRSSKELLSSGGTASGPVSFMRGADASAGTIKSGGATRRAAKMVVLDVDHPDIEEFVETKAKEEAKIRVLRDAGFDMDLGGADIASVQYQNANNSVRVTDEFMRAVESGTEFGLRARKTGEVIESVDARKLFRTIAQAAWNCADPGIQYDGTINDWHTCPESGRITASNPCSEYLHLDNSSCNLASLNLLKFLGEDGRFDAPRFQKAVELIITAMDISICFADFPTEPIGETTRAFRQLGIGYANLGALLMATGHAYDSEGGRALAAAITSLMTGASYKRSAELAGVVGPYEGYARNATAHQRVMRKHAAATDDVRAPVASAPIHQLATQVWQEGLEIGARNGWRNAQASVLAPTGCLTPDTLVSTDRGLARLGELGDMYGDRWQPLDIAVSTDEGPRRATRFFVNGEEPTRRVVTSGGYTIQGTLAHRIKVVDATTGEWAWRRMADVSVGDVVPLQMGTFVGDPRRVPLPVLDEAYHTSDPRLVVPDAVDEELAELLGYFMGDGSLHSKGLRFCVADADLDVVERLRILGKQLFGIDAAVTESADHWEVALHSVRLAWWWQAAGFAEHSPGADHAGKGWTPRVPSAVLESNDPAVYAAFVRGLFEAVGTVAEGVPSMSTSSASFAAEMRTVLLVLGMASTTRETTSGWGGPVVQVRLRNLDDALRYEETVGFIGERKGRLLPELEPAQPGYRDRVGYLFETVAENADGGVAPTFDLSVPENVTYVAAGFVSHNTIGLMMDCDTTGIEPDLALVKFKKLVGGGSMQIVNQTVPRALARLGYPTEQIEAIVEYVGEHGHVVDAPGIKTEHYEVFDCAMGERSIAPMGHVRMMAAVQPFLSGAISKCVVGSTLLTSENGLIRIGSLYGGEQPDTFRDEVLGVASRGGPQKSDAYYYGGERPVREIELRSGHRVTGTPNHRVLVAVPGGPQWRRLDQVREGDHIAVQYGADMWSMLPASFGDFHPCPPYGSQKSVQIPGEMTEELAFLLGAYAAEGCVSASNWTIRIANSVDAVLERVAAAWRMLFGVEAVIDRPRGKCPQVVVASKTIVEFLRYLEVGSRAAEKRIPDAVLRSPRPMVLAFLRGLALDAYVRVPTDGQVKWAICLDSSALLDDLQAILTNLGVVHGRVSKFNKVYSKAYDEVYASGEEAQRMAKLVPFLEPDKAQRAARLIARPPFRTNPWDVVPGITGRQLYAALPPGDGRHEFRHLLDDRTTNPSRATVERVVAVAGSSAPAWLREVLRDGLHFSPILRVRDAGQQVVHDVSVPATRAFVGNGVVNHNTVNMPEAATVTDVEKTYLEGWKLGLKALAIYRDNCKVGQPLSAGKGARSTETATAEARPAVVEARPVRKRLPKKRPSETVSFTVGGAEGYLTAGSYPDDGLGEIFVKLGKQGSTLSGVMDAFSMSISVGLQYGIPLEFYVSKFSNLRFEPAGMTDDPDIRIATSVLDYLFRRLALDHLPYEKRAQLGIFSADERRAQVADSYPPEIDAVVDIEGLRGSVDAQPATSGAESPAAKPAPAEVGSSTELLELRLGKAADAPLCMTCGTKMRPAGSCYVCEGCGSTSGCS